VNKTSDRLLTADCFEDGPWVVGDVDFVSPPQSQHSSGLGGAARLMV
jgi:hypothetical protein